MNRTKLRRQIAWEAARLMYDRQESEYYDDLLLLGQCDRAGRQVGVETPELDEALQYLRDLGGMFP